MLQILLAFLAASIVAVAGFGLVEQLSLQQIMMDQRENARRLDVAAEAISGRLVRMPGREGVFAPSPQNRADGWSYMPAGVGGVNATVDGVPFLYCPIAPEAGSANFQVKSPDGSTYGVQVQGGVVVGSDLGNSTQLGAGMAAYRPAAYIIAANRGDDRSPPSCTDVRERNGRPFVESGLVKVVSRPAGAEVMGTITSGTSDVYVSSTGDGNGSLNDPASIDDALRAWVTFRPAAMTIHLVTDVNVGSAGLWDAFASVSDKSPSRLVIDGNGHTLGTPSTQTGAPARFGLTNVGIVGATFIVGQGDELSTVGDVILQPGSGGSGLYVQSGGRLAVSGGTLRVAGAAQNGVESSGDVTITQGAIAGTSSMGWSLGLLNGGRLWSTNSNIGDQNSRNTLASLAVAGTSSVTSDSGSTVAAAGSGMCWTATNGDDATFSESANGAGTRSGVRADEAPPAITADPTTDAASYQAQVIAYQAWRRQVDARQHARQTNHSNFLCG